MERERLYEPAMRRGRPDPAEAFRPARAEYLSVSCCEQLCHSSTTYITFSHPCGSTSIATPSSRALVTSSVQHRPSLVANNLWIDCEAVGIVCHIHDQVFRRLKKWYRVAYDPACPDVFAGYWAGLHGGDVVCDSNGPRRLVHTSMTCPRTQRVLVLQPVRLWRHRAAIPRSHI
ncbi:hypothetical protein L226DRAFT_139208 [Lentinus tigrinus ALCF2SS1-7]|uniref:uncharacterized protein n=1 Tax=Lentinus tigrinus ALCF2SS1-7 TaxID=1328758 RepID=UPI00116634E7|nr:hypothetical protein L226DRAFT_139208 [Lentinus tigrinus ALCF2SS1-7]